MKRGQIAEREAARLIQHVHCWHIRNGSISTVMPEGHVLQVCCECPTTRTIHADHAHKP